MSSTSVGARAASSAERAAVTLVFFANGLGIGAWAAAIPSLKARFMLTASALSLALLAFAAGAILVMPVAGLVASRHGAARATRLAALGFALSLLLPQAASGFAALVSAAFVLGVANGALDVTMNAHAAAVERRWGRAIMSSFHAAFSAGGLAGAALGGFLASTNPGLTMPAAAAPVAILAAFAWPALRDGDHAPSVAGPRFLLPSRAALPLCAAALVCMLCEGAMADWSGVYLRTVADASQDLTSLGYVAFSAAMLMGRAGGDSVVRALGRSVVVGAGAVISAAGLVLAVLLPTPALAPLGFALVGLGLANVVPAVFSTAGSVAASPAAGIAMVATAGYAGFLIGPVAIGIAAAAAGLRASLLLLAAGSMVVGALAGSLRNRSPHLPG